MVKQKGGGTGTKGSITGRFTETLIGLTALHF